MCGNIIFTEVHYHRRREIAISSEFVEIKNIGNKSILMTGAVFSRYEDGLYVDNYTFPELILQPGQFWVISFYLEDFKLIYGKYSDGVHFMRLSPERLGDRVTIFDQFGHMVDDFKFTTELPWSKYADGFGYTLVAKPGGYDKLAATGSEPGTLDEIRHWRYSSAIGGSPWSDDPKPILSRALGVEISFASFSSNPQWVELYNTKQFPIDIGGWAIAQSIINSEDKRKVYYFPDNFVLKAGQFIKITNVTTGFQLKKGTTLFKATCCYEGNKFMSGDFIEFQPTSIAFDKKRLNFV